MKVIAKKNRELNLINAQNTQNENRAETITLVVPEEYEDYNKKIVFVTPNEIVWDVITNNEYKITKAITKYDEVEFYIWLTKDNVDFRTQTKPLRFYHNQDASNEITQEQINGVNTVVNLLEEEIEKVENLNIEATKIGDTTTVTITKKDGTTESVEINDGADGYTPQKGTDYFTQEDIEEIEGDILNEVYTKSETDTLLEGKADTTDIPDVSSFITKDVNNLTNYTLKTNTGSLIDLEINDTTYVVTLKLKNQDGTVISTDTIDLPLESVVVSGRYDNTTKKVILTLENGSEVDFSVADLVAGLQTEITSQNKLASDLIDDTNNGNKFVTTSEKQTWNNKYDKPNNGIPKTDLASDVQTSLGKADTAIQSHQDISGKEDETNKVTSIDNTSTDTQYPSAKCVYDSQEEQNTEIGNLQAENERLRNTIPTTTGTGQAITLNKTAELEFVKPPLPMGNSEQVQYSGKNLLNLTNLTERTINGVTFTPVYENRLLKYINVNGTATANANYYFGQDSIVTLESGTYTWGGSATDINLGINFGEIYYNTSSSRQITLSETATSGQPYIQVPNGKRISNVKLYPQLELGNSATSYEPYTFGQAPNPNFEVPITNVTGDVEVVVGNKNLFDKNNMQKGFIPVSGDYPTSNPSYPNARYYLVPVKANDSVAISGSTNNFGRVRCIDNVSNQVIGTISTSENDYYTSNNNYSSGFVNAVITAKKDIILAFMVIQGTDTLDTFQVEYGSTATLYTQHHEQTFTFPLGNEKLMLGDYLADDGIHHVRGQEVYNGSEDWIIRSDTSTNDFLCCRISGYLKDTWKSIFLCSHFEVKKSADSTHNNIRLVNADSYGAQITISRNIAATVNDFKNWLTEQYNNNSPVIVEYELNEEVIVPYTSAQQTAYNQIKQALSYEGQTNISSNQNAIFNVEAYQSTKLILESIDSRLTLVEG